MRLTEAPCAASTCGDRAGHIRRPAAWSPGGLGSGRRRSPATARAPRAVTSRARLRGTSGPEAAVRPRGRRGGAAGLAAIRARRCLAHEPRRRFGMRHIDVVGRGVAKWWSAPTAYATVAHHDDGTAFRGDHLVDGRSKAELRRRVWQLTTATSAPGTEHAPAASASVRPHLILQAPHLDAKDRSLLRFPA